MKSDSTWVKKKKEVFESFSESLIIWIQRRILGRAGGPE